jgi:uncharacterized surface protein with fasciclin (FAS1) repeats
LPRHFTVLALVLAIALSLSRVPAVRGLGVRSVSSKKSHPIQYERYSSTMRMCSEGESVSASDTILEVLGKNPKWSTFRTLLTAMPELTSTMKNKDLILDTIYTVFVPTNAAFAKLDKDTLFKIGKKDNLPILRKLVRHHFVDDVMSVDDMRETDKIMTLALLEINVRPASGSGFGGLLGVGTNNEAAGGIRLNEGIITTPDIQCCNGVIHEVDNLLNPFLYYRYLV